MEDLQRNSLLLRGIFAEQIFEGARTISYLFKDINSGWYSVTAVKKDIMYEQIKLEEACDIKVNVKGKLKATGTEIHCFNDLIIEAYEPQTTNIKGDKNNG